jgi:DNA-binding response OmpR family regulator
MPKVILVEDDPMIGEIYQKKFSSEGFEATIATSGAEFLSKVKMEKFDLVLLDMVLPEMSGLEILREIKKNKDNNPDMKVFIFSNLNEKEDYEKAREEGADGYIPKAQFSPSELVNEVKRLMVESDERKKNETNSNGNGNNGRKNKKKILFIEDEKAFIEIFCKKLIEDGYEVETAENGAWGLKEALNKDFDLIITDMVMPAMTGQEIIEKLRLEDKTKNIPIIVISASSTDEKIKEINELGVSEFLVKTQIVPSVLSRKVGEILMSQNKTE